MKLTSFFALVTALVAAVPAAAQDTLAVAPPLDSVDVLVELPMPATLPEVEVARTKRCVPLLNGLDALNAELAPIRQRAARLAGLIEAVALEDTTRAVPFAANDPVETAVRDWFRADELLARQFLASGDTTLQARRTEGREAILAQVRAAGQAAVAEGEQKVTATGDLVESAQDCLGVMLVRPAVIEACAGADSPLCTEARDSTPNGRFRLVDIPEDVWGVETLRPWTTPSRLGISVQGSLSGASTNATVARGNVALVVGLEPIVQEKATVAPEDLVQLEAALDSLGLTFDHPQFLLVPGLAIRLVVGPALGGESYYFLHFGDLSDPARDVIWSASAATGAPLAYMAPVPKNILDRLAAGEAITLTAVAFPQAGSMEGDAVYVLELPNVGQAGAVQSLMQYIATGELLRDFNAIAPTMPPAPGVQ